MSWRPLVLFYMLLCSTWSVAQITSSLSGSTSDASTGTSLPGATVQVFVGDTSYSTVSDATGTFRLSHLPTGSIAFARASSVMGRWRMRRCGCVLARRNALTCSCIER
ncbi:MAG: carboxypeptidase regulatory-like domain-containing protein [Flavobacteriales bacterium]|nr:carboxypeptidase regulatory-like domain-containing protein [Flavobacteriales bacterium]